MYGRRASRGLWDALNIQTSVCFYEGKPGNPRSNLPNIPAYCSALYLGRLTREFDFDQGHGDAPGKYAYPPDSPVPRVPLLESECLLNAEFELELGLGPCCSPSYPASVCYLRHKSDLEGRGGSRGVFSLQVRETSPFLRIEIQNQFQI